MSFEKVNLQKEQIVNLVKNTSLANQKARVVICLDYSGSMYYRYKYNKVQELLNRLFPIALAFDDDQQSEVYIFEDKAWKISPSLTINNYENYVDVNIIKKNYPSGGTNYAPAVNMIVEDAKNLNQSNIKSSFLSFFSSNKNNQVKLPTFVIFISDGECTDISISDKAFQDSSKYPVFFSLWGLGNDAEFKYLKKLDTLPKRLLDNTSFSQVSEFEKISDDELYRSSLLKEFPTWYDKARELGLF